MIPQTKTTEQLPKGWTSVTLEDYISIAGRIGWRGLKKEEYLHEGIPLLAIKDILENGSINFNVTDYLSNFRYEESPEIQLKNNDILVTKDGTIGKIGFVENLPTKVTVNSSILVVRPCRAIFPKFLFYYFKGPKFQKLVREKIAGTAVPHLFQHDIRKFEIHVPPFNEQHRIVGKVEELFSFLDAGVASLRKVRAQLKRYRQAVMKYAFEGKLTEEWRRTHKDQIEPAVKLLEQIKGERKKKLKDKYRERPLVEFDNAPKLSNGWVWTNCGTLSWFVTSGSRDWKKYYSDTGPLFIRTQDINTNKLNLEEVAHVRIPEKTEGKRSLVEKNDILTIITGANVGKVALVDRDVGEAYISQSVALIKLVMPQIAKFVHFSMIADGFGKTHLNRLVYGMGRPVLSLENIRDVVIPLAPLAEQPQIISEIDRRLSQAEEIEKIVNYNVKCSERMRQSILSAAFGGMLVPQDPTDEPAEKLLERIKAEHFNNKITRIDSQVGLSRYVK